MKWTGGAAWSYVFLLTLRRWAPESIISKASLMEAPFGWLVQLGWARLEMEVGRIGHLTLVYTRRQLCRWLFGHRAHVKLLGLYVSGRS